MVHLSKKKRKTNSNSFNVKTNLFCENMCEIIYEREGNEKNSISFILIEMSSA